MSEIEKVVEILSKTSREGLIFKLKPLLEAGQRLHDCYGWGGRTPYGVETWAWEAAIKKVLEEV